VPKMHLTDPAVKKIKASAGARVDYFDTLLGHGFALRVSGPTPTSPIGSKSWVQFYRHRGKLKRGTLGTYPALGLGDARDKARDWQIKAKRGVDPAAAEQAIIAASDRPGELTITALVEEYLARWARPKKRSADEDERMLRKDVIPQLGARPVSEVTRRDLVLLLDRIVDRGAPITANRTLAAFRRMFNFAIERGIIETSPCVKVKAPAAERVRERNLAEAEILAFWKALDVAPMEVNLRQALRFLLVIAQRKSEVTGMRWPEMRSRASGEAQRADGPFTPIEWVWALPAERVKNKREHVVPLSLLAIEVLLEATPSEDGWVFPALRTGLPYGDQAADHAVRNLFSRRAPKVKRAPVLEGAERFTPHDLRRTATTRMRDLGVSKDDVKLVLNHIDRSITGRHYDRYEGLREKRRALELWGAYLESLIRPAPANVVALAAR
jgi:integrase